MIEEDQVLDILQKSSPGFLRSVSYDTVWAYNEHMKILYDYGLFSCVGPTLPSTCHREKNKNRGAPGGLINNPSVPFFLYISKKIIDSCLKNKQEFLHFTRAD